MIGIIQNVIVWQAISDENHFITDNYITTSRTLHTPFHPSAHEVATVNQLSYSIHCLILALLLVFSGQDVLAGNLSLIEKRLEELDRLNKEAVAKSGPLPQNGSVEIKAKVLPGLETTDQGKAEKNFSFLKKSVTALDEKQPFTIQISASRSKEQSFRVANMLRRAGYPAFTASLELKENDIWHRIFVGSYASREDAEKVKLSLEADQIRDSLIRSMPYAIQVGKIGSYDDLRTVKDQLTGLKYLPYMGSLRDTATDSSKSRILVGAFEKREETALLLDELRRSGLQARVVNR